MSEMRIVGKPRTKIDAVGKVTGAAKYGDDMMLPRMVYGKLLRSIEPHAHIRRVDVSRALALCQQGGSPHGSYRTIAPGKLKALMCWDRLGGLFMHTDRLRRHDNGRARALPGRGGGVCVSS